MYLANQDRCAVAHSHKNSGRRKYFTWCAVLASIYSYGNAKDLRDDEPLTSHPSDNQLQYDVIWIIVVLYVLKAILEQEIKAMLRFDYVTMEVAKSSSGISFLFSFLAHEILFCSWDSLWSDKVRTAGDSIQRKTEPMIGSGDKVKPRRKRQRISRVARNINNRRYPSALMYIPHRFLILFFFYSSLEMLLVASLKQLHLNTCYFLWGLNNFYFPW